jgi:hypothetical protein
MAKENGGDQMTLVDMALIVRTAWNVLFDRKPEAPSRYVLHLESEIVRLQDENARLQIKLEVALAPKPAPAPIKRDLSGYSPAKTSWEGFLEAEVERQEREYQEEQASKSAVTA